MKRELAALLSSNEFPQAAVAELEALAHESHPILGRLVAEATVASDPLGSNEYVVPEDEPTPIYDAFEADPI